jgi:hypothetical protein
MCRLIPSGRCGIRRTPIQLHLLGFKNLPEMDSHIQNEIERIRQDAQAKIRQLAQFSQIPQFLETCDLHFSLRDPGPTQDYVEIPMRFIQSLLLQVPIGTPANATHTLSTQPQPHPLSEPSAAAKNAHNCLGLQHQAIQRGSEAALPSARPPAFVSGTIGQDGGSSAASTESTDAAAGAPRLLNTRPNTELNNQSPLQDGRTTSRKRTTAEESECAEKIVRSVVLEVPAAMQEVHPQPPDSGRIAPAALAAMAELSHCEAEVVATDGIAASAEMSEPCQKTIHGVLMVGKAASAKRKPCHSMLNTSDIPLEGACTKLSSEMPVPHVGQILGHVACGASAHAHHSSTGGDLESVLPAANAAISVNRGSLPRSQQETSAVLGDVLQRSETCLGRLAVHDSGGASCTRAPDVAPMDAVSVRSQVPNGSDERQEVAQTSLSALVVASAPPAVSSLVTSARVPLASPSVAPPSCAQLACTRPAVPNIATRQHIDETSLPSQRARLPPSYSELPAVSQDSLRAFGLVGTGQPQQVPTRSHTGLFKAPQPPLFAPNRAAEAGAPSVLLPALAEANQGPGCITTAADSCLISREPSMYAKSPVVTSFNEVVTGAGGVAACVMGIVSEEEVTDKARMPVQGMDNMQAMDVDTEEIENNVACAHAPLAGPETAHEANVEVGVKGSGEDAVAWGVESAEQMRLETSARETQVREHNKGVTKRGQLEVEIGVVNTVDGTNCADAGWQANVEAIEAAVEPDLGPLAEKLELGRYSTAGGDGEAHGLLNGVGGIGSSQHRVSRGIHLHRRDTSRTSSPRERSVCRASSPDEPSIPQPDWSDSVTVTCTRPQSKIGAAHTPGRRHSCPMQCHITEGVKRNGARQASAPLSSQNGISMREVTALFPQSTAKPMNEEGLQRTRQGTRAHVQAPLGACWTTELSHVMSSEKSRQNEQNGELISSHPVRLGAPARQTGSPQNDLRKLRKSMRLPVHPSGLQASLPPPKSPQCLQENEVTPSPDTSQPETESSPKKLRSVGLRELVSLSSGGADSMHPVAMALTHRPGSATRTRHRCRSSAKLATKPAKAFKKMGHTNIGRSVHRKSALTDSGTHSAETVREPISISLCTASAAGQAILPREKMQVAASACARSSDKLVLQAESCAREMADQAASPVESANALVSNECHTGFVAKTGDADPGSAVLSPGAHLSFKQVGNASAGGRVACVMCATHTSTADVPSLEADAARTAATMAARRSHQQTLSIRSTSTSHAEGQSSEQDVATWNGEAHETATATALTAMHVTKATAISDEQTWRQQDEVGADAGVADSPPLAEEQSPVEEACWDATAASAALAPAAASGEAASIVGMQTRCMLGEVGVDIHLVRAGKLAAVNSYPGQCKEKDVPAGVSGEGITSVVDKESAGCSGVVIRQRMRMHQTVASVGKPAHETSTPQEVGLALQSSIAAGKSKLSLGTGATEALDPPSLAGNAKDGAADADGTAAHALLKWASKRSRSCAEVHALVAGEVGRQSRSHTCSVGAQSNGKVGRSARPAKRMRSHTTAGEMQCIEPETDAVGSGKWIRNHLVHVALQAYVGTGDITTAHKRGADKRTTDMPADTRSPTNTQKQVVNSTFLEREVHPLGAPLGRVHMKAVPAMRELGPAASMSPSGPLQLAHPLAKTRSSGAVSPEIFSSRVPKVFSTGTPTPSPATTVPEAAHGRQSPLGAAVVLDLAPGPSQLAKSQACRVDSAGLAPVLLSPHVAEALPRAPASGGAAATEASNTALGQPLLAGPCDEALAKEQSVPADVGMCTQDPVRNAAATVGKKRATRANVALVYSNGNGHTQGRMKGGVAHAAVVAKGSGASYYRGTDAPESPCASAGTPIGSLSSDCVEDLSLPAETTSNALPNSRVDTCSLQLPTHSVTVPSTEAVPTGANAADACTVLPAVAHMPSAAQTRSSQSASGCSLPVSGEDFDPVDPPRAAQTAHFVAEAALVDLGSISETAGDVSTVTASKATASPVPSDARQNVTKELVGDGGIVAHSQLPVEHRLASEHQDSLAEHMGSSYLGGPGFGPISALAGHADQGKHLLVPPD